MPVHTPKEKAKNKRKLTRKVKKAKGKVKK